MISRRSWTEQTTFQLFAIRPSPWRRLLSSGRRTIAFAPSSDCVVNKTCTELSGLPDFQAEQSWTRYPMSATVALIAGQYAGASSSNCVALCTQFSTGRVRRIWLTSLSLLVPAVHVVSASVPRRRPTTRCHGCAQSSLNVRSHMQDLLHGTNWLPEDLGAVADPAEFRKQLKTHFSLQLIMFTDICHRGFYLLCFRSTPPIDSSEST